MTVKLGDMVKDTVTGFEGVAIARHSYLQGCDRISVQPVLGKDKTMPSQEGFDEPQLEVTKAGFAIPDPKPSKARTGGPDKHPDTLRSEG